MGIPVIQTSFASGEWAPKLYGRVDIQKYKVGAALLRNFFCDYSGGGASTRQGTKFIAQAGANGARLIPFQPSSNVSYVLEFGQGYIQFYTNGAQIQLGGLPYSISTPYKASDLFPNPATGNPGLKFVQDVTSLIICHPSYPPQILTIISPTNWTLTAINFGPTIATPTNLAVTSTYASGTAWYYSYLVTAVDINGQESAVPTPVTYAANTFYIGVNQGSNTITWNAVPGAPSYNVYKASPSFDAPPPAGAQYGFIGNVTATTFIESFPGIGADFSTTPPISENPFLGAGVQSLALTANATYTTVPTITIAAPPSGVQATAGVSLHAATVAIAGGGTLNADPLNQTFSGPYNSTFLCTGSTNISPGIWTATSLSIANGGSLTGAGTAVPGNPIAISSAAVPGSVPVTVNLTWNIGALNLFSDGAGYITAPAVTISGSATATSTLQPQSNGNPGVPTFFQERLMLAAQTQSVQDYNLSQPQSFFNFNISNPSEDDDAISGQIIAEELNDIRSLVPVPTGVIALTGKGAWLINGGGGISTNNPITPANQTAQPQAFNGANDLRPLKINLDMLYATNKGSYVRDLTYNIYANIYTGADISVLSNHLFFGHNILDWAWSEEPFKTLWAVREDGILLSLGFVKEQDLIGWAHHDTNGQFLSVCSVIENVQGVNVDAVYVIVQRLVNGSYVQYVERMADRFFTYGYEDSWSVDCALQTVPQSTFTSPLTIAGALAVGATITLTDNSSSPFTGTSGWALRASGGIYKITSVAGASSAQATVVRLPNTYNTYNGFAFIPSSYSLWQPVTTISGLTQLVGMSVVGVADGVVVGPFTVSGGGTVTLTTAASKVTLGLSYLPQLISLPLDIGEPTVQSKRKKENAFTLRCADTLGLQIGTSFGTCVTIKDLQLGAIPSQSNGPALITDLVNPSLVPTFPLTDAYTILDPLWQETGQVFIQQNLPYPATILALIPEIAMGDTEAK